MKLKVKKFIYLVNDVTNIILKKDRVKAEENVKKLRIALIVVSIILVLSIALNIYLYLN
jgi:fumarate reductase subunit C